MAVRGSLLLGVVSFNYCFNRLNTFTFDLKKQAFVIHLPISKWRPYFINNILFNFMNLCIWEVLLNWSRKKI